MSARLAALLGLLLLAIPLMASDCVQDLGLVGEGDPTQGELELRLAMSKLEQHDVRGAAHDFERAAASDPLKGEALAGEALTRLLLLPEDPAVGSLVRLLGGKPFDMQADFYGDDGVLAHYARRTDQLKVEERLEAALPWSAEQRADVSRVASRLRPELTGNEVADALAEVAAATLDVAELFARAADAPGKTRFEFPHGTFHGRTFIGVRASELRLLDGALRAAAAGMLWVAAYDWPMTADQLSARFSLRSRVERFNEGALRRVRAPERLEFARGLMRQSFERLAMAAQSGVHDETRGGLLWSALSLQEALALQTFLRELAMSVDLSTPLSGAPIRAHVGAAFEGRTLDEGQALAELGGGLDQGGDERLETGYDAIASILLDGVLDPYCHPDPEVEDPGCPEFLSAGLGSSEPWERIMAPLRRSLAADYGL